MLETKWIYKMRTLSPLGLNIDIDINCFTVEELFNYFFFDWFDFYFISVCFFIYTFFVVIFFTANYWYVLKLLIM